VHFTVDTLFQADDLVRNAEVRSFLHSLLIFLQTQLVALEDAQEGLIVNTCLLIAPEMLDETLHFLLVNAQFHVLEDILEVITRE